MILLTAWWNTQPLLTSLGFHSSLARGEQINFLAANRNFPTKNQTGSGIYTTNGTIASWTSPSLPSTHLTVADVPVVPLTYLVDWPSYVDKIGPTIAANNDTFEMEMFFDTFTVINGSQVKRIFKMDYLC